MRLRKTMNIEQAMVSLFHMRTESLLLVGDRRLDLEIPL